MKLETLVYDKIKKTLPAEARKTVVFANVSATSYEIFFYCYFPKRGYVQCYNLAEKNILDANLLDKTFNEVAEMIKADKKYDASSNNLFTFVIDDFGVEMSVNYLDKSARLYRVKKEWKEKHLIL